MFIFGWGNRQRVIEAGSFLCPVCQADSRYRHLRDRRWMTLFFIPVIPLSGTQDFIRCDRCQTTIPREMFEGKSPAAGKAELSQVAVVGMILGILSLLTFCLFIFSIPLAITAVILGHMGWQRVRQHKPHVEGGWQAITAMATGYTALLLSVTLFLVAMMLPIWFPPDDSRLSNGRSAAENKQDDGPFSFSASSNEAFKSAEYDIASKRGQPAGRGNSPKAVEMANEYAERLKEFSDAAFTSEGRPLLQLSGGEYLTFCELHEDRCLFLVHVPSYRKFTGDAKKALAEVAWAVAQIEVAGKLPPNAKLGVGLRGVLTYGDIMLGTCPASSDDKITTYTSGKENDLLAFFVNENSSKEKSQPKVVSPFESSEPTTPSGLTMDQPGPPDNDVFAAVGTPAEKSPTGAGPTDAEPKVTNNDSSMLPPTLAQPSSPPMIPPAMPTAPPALPPAATTDANNNRERRPKKPVIDFENQIPVKLTSTFDNPMWAFKALAFSPDGKWLAAGKADEAVYVFDARSGETICKLERLDALGPVSALAYSANGEYLAAGGDRGQVMCWKVTEDGSLAASQMQHGFESAVECLVTSPKHTFFMAANRKGTIAWQSFGPNKSQPRLLQEFSRNVRALWLPNGTAEAMATDGAKLIKFSLKDGEISNSKEIGVKDCRFAAFSPTGKRLVIAGFDTWHFIDLEHNQSRRTMKAPRGEMIHSLLFHKNERWIATGMRGKVGLLDFDKAAIIAYADAESIMHQDSLAFTNDGKFLAACPDSAQGPIKIFQLGESQ